MDMDLSPKIPIHKGEFSIDSHGEEPFRKISSSSTEKNDQSSSSPDDDKIRDNSTINLHYMKGKEVISLIEKQEESPSKNNLNNLESPVVGSLNSQQKQVEERNMTQINLVETRNIIEKECMRCRIF